MIMVLILPLIPFSSVISIFIVPYLRLLVCCFVFIDDHLPSLDDWHGVLGLLMRRWLVIIEIIVGSPAGISTTVEMMLGVVVYRFDL